MPVAGREYGTPFCWQRHRQRNRIRTFMEAKCSCQYCNGHISFESSDAGRTVACPHCKLETILFIPPTEIGKPRVRGNSAESKSATKHLFAAIGFTVASVAVVAALFAIVAALKPKVSGQILADWLPDSNLRVVGGQSYDVEHSELWKNPVELAGFRSHGNENSRLVTYLAKVETVAKDKIQCGIYAQAHWPPVANGEVESVDMVQEISIYHYPNAEFLISGQALGDCQCMRVGNYNDHGISFAAFDCGVPPLNPECVSVIKNAKVKVSGVQILLVDAKEVSDYLQNKKNESDQKCIQTKADIEKLKVELNDAQANFDKVKNPPADFIQNDPRYIGAVKKYNDIKQEAAKKFNNAIKYYPSAMPNPASAEFTEKTEQASKELEGLPSLISAEWSSKFDVAQNALGAVKQKLNEANHLLEMYQAPVFYFSDFNPRVLGKAQIKQNGEFMIPNFKPRTKVFAKAKSYDTGETFFWLLNAPQKGEKLILSDKNLFTPPTNTP